MSDSLFIASGSIIGENRAREQAMRSAQARRVADSLIGVPHDTYANRVAPAADLDLVSIELGLIAAQARAAGLASLDDCDPMTRLLVADIESALERTLLLKALRTT